MVSKMFDLTDRVAVITGGGTGIGKSIAEGLARAGAHVVLCSRRIEKCKEASEEIKQKTDVKALACACDVTNKNDIRNMVKSVMDNFGRIDILVNNAGVSSNYHFLELTEEEWDKTINTNLKGVFLVSKAITEVMVEAKKGVIINIGSQLGETARACKAHYVTTKGGLKLFTKALAIDLAPYGIRVNNIAPGPVETELSRPTFSDPEAMSEVLTRMPLNRMGQPDDLAGAAVFLASDSASFVTGVTLYVDGGYLTR
jgi:gluconate 5-dehydrogenase